MTVCVILYQILLSELLVSLGCTHACTHNTHTHTVLPHHSFLHNIVTFLERAHMPGGLSLERLQSFTRPPTQAEQIEQIKAVTSMRYAKGII